MLTLLDISEVSSMIQRFKSYNLLTNKVAEKGPWTIYRPDTKAKNVSESQNWTLHKGQYWSPQI